MKKKKTFSSMTVEYHVEWVNHRYIHDVDEHTGKIEGRSERKKKVAQ